jgi:hypothetical protein
MFLPQGRLINTDILHLIHNPVKIAQYFHLVDGMK